MLKVKRITWMIGCALSLGGCAMTFQAKEISLAELEIKPIEHISHATSKPRILYLLGRYYQGKANHIEAIKAYRKALALKPDYVEAHNGLGVIYSKQGDFESAFRHFSAALELAPAESYLHNNVGYALLLQNQENEAMTHFSRAMQLDPNNVQARKNLTAVFEKLGLHEGAKDQIMDQATVKTVQQSPYSALLEIAPNVYTYQALDNPSVSTAKPPEKTRPVEKRHEPVPGNQLLKHGIEISNGNGITGMARKVSAYLEQFGADSIRLTNHETFQQKSTEIHYRPGSLQYANTLNQILPEPVSVIERNDLRSDIQVKVLLGRDISHASAHFDRENNRESQPRYSQSVQSDQTDQRGQLISRTSN
ncbi:MAG: tetratricopeptide repeat protein [Nitrosomonas sp.]|nr:tetratricopeptide repeat protein [Nitrosomonas sp.]MDR4652082.1 tetratricopeptide repeat protein [Nitrosomonas sp.]